MTTNRFPILDSMYVAYLNLAPADVRAGYRRVRARYGEDGAREIRRATRTGAMAIFNRPSTPRTRLYVRTVALAAEARVRKERARS